MRKPSKPRAMSEQGDDSSDRPVRGASPLVTAFNIFNCAVGADPLPSPTPSPRRAPSRVSSSRAPSSASSCSPSTSSFAGTRTTLGATRRSCRKRWGGASPSRQPHPHPLHLRQLRRVHHHRRPAGVVAQFARNAARASLRRLPDAASAAAAEANAAATVRACDRARVRAGADAAEYAPQDSSPATSSAPWRRCYTPPPPAAARASPLRAGPDGAPRRRSLASGGASWWSSVDSSAAPRGPSPGKRRPVAVRRGRCWRFPSLSLRFSAIQILSPRRVQGRTQGRGRRGGQVASERLVVARMPRSRPRGGGRRGFPGFFARS